MYLKSSHTHLVDGAHQWEVTLFCSAEANNIASVEMLPKSRRSHVFGNEAKPAPTAYTMLYTVSPHEDLPDNFSATIVFKSGERKIVTVPANTLTDRKRRRADALETPPPTPPATPTKKRKRFCFPCFTKSTKSTLSEKPSLSEQGDQDVAPTKCRGCCIQ